jgi:transcriptional regulator with XRE-family HTH domain
MQSTFTQRFNRLIDYYKTSQTKIAVGAGITKQTINNLKKGSPPRYDQMYKLLTYFKEVDANWLILGEGAMLKSGVNEGLVSEPFERYNSSESKADYDRLKRMVDYLMKRVETLSAENSALRGEEKQSATGT